MFDGASTCVELASSNGLLARAPFTVAAFVDVTVYADVSNTKARYLVSKANGVPTVSAWRFASDATTRFTFKLGMPGNAVEVETPDGQPTGRWIHVAAVFQPAQRLEIWQDGTLQGSLLAPAALVDDPDASVRVGCLKAASFFDGAVDELRLYTRALEQAELGALARASK